MVSKDTLETALCSLTKEKRELLEAYSGYESHVDYDVSVLDKAITEIQNYLKSDGDL